MRQRCCRGGVVFTGSILLTLTCVTNTLNAATYYVSPTGNDASPGTLSQPWRTLPYAVSRAFAGDTVMIRAGSYRPSGGAQYVMQLTRSGTPAAPIVFQAYPGESPVLDASVSGVRRNWCVYVNGADHVQIRGLEMVAAKRAGIRLTTSDHSVVAECRIHDIRDPTTVGTVVGGIVVIGGTSTGNQILRNDVYDCSRGIVVRNEGGTPITNALVEANYIHDIQWWNTAQVRNNQNADGVILNTTTGAIVRRNLITRCGDDGIDCYNSNFAIIEANTVYNSGDGLSGASLTAGGDGNGIKVSTGGGGGHLVIRNLTFNCERAGFDQDHVQTTAPGNTFYHNVSYGNGRNGFILERASSTPNILRNNIAFANDQEDGGYRDIRITSTAVVLNSDYNLWSDGLDPTGEGVHSLAGDPLFVALPTPYAQIASPANLGIVLDRARPWFAQVPGLMLTESSPGIDAGVPLAAPYDGAAPDLGAYEAQ